MLRLLGLLPPVEPTEQELAEARILEQTGYTSETIQGFKEQIRERDRQLVQLEDELTRRILLLQKERDEALLGRGVGLSPRAPLHPAGVDDAAALAEAGPADGQGGGGLDEAQAQQYEQHIAELNAHIDHLEQQLEQVGRHAEQQPQQAQQQEEGEEEQPPTDHDDDQPQQPQPQQQQASESEDATLAELSQRAAAAEAEAEHWRSVAERATHEKEQLERRLSELPVHAEAPNGTEGHDGRAKVDSLRAQLEEANRIAEERRVALEDQQQRATDGHAQMQQLHEQLQATQHQLQTAQQQLQEASNQQQAAIDPRVVHELQEQLSHSQTHAAGLDGEVRRLQSELLRLQSIDQQAPAPAAAAADDAASAGDAAVPPPAECAECVQLRAQVSLLQSQLSQQLSSMADERKRTQATLHEKLAQVKTVMQKKDDTIAKLRAELSAQNATPPQPHAGHLAPQSHAHTQSPGQLSPQPHAAHPHAYGSPQQQPQYQQQQTPPQPQFHSPQHAAHFSQVQQQHYPSSPAHASTQQASQDGSVLTPPPKQRV